MNKNQEVFEKGSKYLMPTYKRLPIVFTKGKMQYLWDIEGNKYIDFIAGYGCLNVGHSNKYVIDALKGQIDKIIQPSNVYYNTTQVELAERLCSITGFGEKIFFANSGTESIEAALKLARKYSTDKYNPGRYEIITFNKSFHGRTLGALAATAQPKKQKLFEPLLDGFSYADLNDKDSVLALLTDNTCAILLEPIQGEGGVNLTDKDFMLWLRDICTKKDIMLILDEVQSGFGRTGSMFAFQNYNIEPDILVIAKSLGGGMPIGAIISTDKIAECFGPGSHGSTFGGNAASCSAGLAVLDYILDNKLEERAADIGDYFIKKLGKLAEKYQIIKEVRGAGLMIGLEFNIPAADKIVEQALEDGLVLNKVSSYTLRFLPPLIIEKDDIDVLVLWLDKNIGAIKSET